MTTKEPRYNHNGIRIEECFSCHKDELLCKMARLGELFCQSCFLRKEAEAIKNWHIDFKNFRNGKDWSKVRGVHPLLSDYIN